MTGLKEKLMEMIGDENPEDVSKFVLTIAVRQAHSG
jgi:hypothetical protein